MDSKTNTLTITGNVDLSNGSLHPLTIALDAVSKIVVDSDASFNAGSTPVAAAVECNGTITGQPLRGLRRSQARLRHSLLHWAYFGLFRALRAASVRPSTLHPFGASKGLLRAASPTGRALRAPPWERGAFWVVVRRRE